jgi:hypothetical protein
MKNHHRQTFVEAFGVRYLRSICGHCGLTCVSLGEAIRVDCAEGRFVILHVCMPCVKRRALRAGHGREARAA